MNSRTTVSAAARRRAFAIVCSCSMAGCGPVVEEVCYLPTLQTNERTRVVTFVGSADDRSTDSCPAAIPRKLAIAKPYGVIYLEWWGSTHRLFMRVESSSGSLDIVGKGVEPYSDPSGSWLAEYSHARKFAGNNFFDSAPLPESFAISIVGNDLPDGALDRIEFEYGTERCTCRYRDW